jgi:predicted CXXCH cytochrome family protein
MQVREDMLDSCRECHPRYFSDAVRHDPVSSGDCDTCHQPHRSELLHLLRQPVYNTCVDCHDEPEDLSEEAHGGDILESGAVKNCTVCHDPHFGAEKLLRPGHEK